MNGSHTRFVRWFIHCIVIGALGTTLFGQPTQPRVARPTTVIEPAGCVTADCHPGVKATPVVHGPVAADSCDGCHQLTSAEKHTFAVTRQKADLCTFCHAFSIENMPMVHKPVAEGECLGCHNPHGGNTPGLLREASVQAMCDSCHVSVKHGTFVHAPVAQGECDSCHPPHAAMFPKLLDAVGSDLCLSCHKEFEPAMAGAKSVHKAMKEGCDRCHDAHASNAPMVLRAEPRDLCVECHEGVQQKMATAKVKHSAVATDRACMNCHAPHASNVGQLLAEKPVDGCLRCHDRAVKTEDGRTIAAVKDVADPRLVKHGEIRDGTCSGCHEVHGATHASLLKKQYTTDFYQQFSPEDQALCFECHDVRLAQAESTDSLTAFRNGTSNLHFIHANRGSRDKNCGACHATHASPNERIVRNVVAFGKWNMPMRFSKTDSGGSCLPGCHREYGYDREIPVDYGEAAKPTQAHPGVRAINEEVRKIEWWAQDTSGRRVAVPHAQGAATAMVMLSADDPAAEQVVANLRGIIPQTEDTQVIVVISGVEAKTKAAAVARAAGNWPVIADADLETSSALGVRGTPLVLVYRGDGLELARVSGEISFLALKLMPYLDLASGKIDEATARRQLAAERVNEVPPAGRATRDLNAARILLNEGRHQEALVILGRDASVAAMPQAQLMRAEGLIRTERADEAVAILDRLPAALPQNTIKLLRAEAMIQQQRWSWARQLAVDLVQNDPSAEAHRIMGRIFEHEKNWEKAAEHYRMASEMKR